MLMLPIVDADKHNFGQMVKPTERASSLWYQKPRPVYWEELFFGKNSPLKTFFSGIGQNGKQSLEKYIFNLEIEVQSDWAGYSKAVPRLSNLKITDEHFYSFGVLLGYSFLFGIRDLHKFNLILTESHLQVIDAEVVMTNLLLPNETVLLPFKDVAFNLCGISLICESLESLTPQDRWLIFAGYFDVFASAFQKQSEICETIQESSRNSPIRVIVRNTREYTKHISGESRITDLMLEEEAQIARGDIPYFFKKLGDENLFWISSKNGESQVVNNLGVFKSDVARHASSAVNLVGTQDLVEKKMVQGAFLIQKKLFDKEKYEFLWNQKSLVLDSSACINGFTDRKFFKKTNS